jgi:hypothetical protein
MTEKANTLKKTRNLATSNIAVSHSHANKTLLDSINQSLLDDSHTHSNKAILDGTEESFTTELKLDITRVLVTTITLDMALSNGGLILADCTAGDITITLPTPANLFTNSRSNSVGISKIDTTANKVTILPNSAELIVGESSIELLYSNEIINLITDGTNWYMGA